MDPRPKPFPPRPGPSARLTVSGASLAATVARLRHHRRGRAALAALLILGSLLMLSAERASVDRLRREWQPIAPSWVITRPLEAGHVVEPGDVEARTLPPAALPSDAVEGSPVGRRLADSVATGEIVRNGRLDVAGATANASRIGDRRGALTLPSPTPHLEPGDRVDLYALLDGRRVAEDAELIAVVDGFPLVAIDEHDLPAAIQALTLGDLVPVLTG